MARSTKRISWRVSTATVAILCASAVIGASAFALTPAPGWEVTARSFPTNLAPGGTGRVQIDVYNVGAAASSAGATVTEVLPPGVTYAEGQQGGCNGTSVITCTVGVVAPERTAVLNFAVNVASSVSGGATGQLTAAGGGALSPASAVERFIFSAAPAAFGVAGITGWLSNVDGTTDTQAGSHPYELTIAIDFNSVIRRAVVPAGGEVRNLGVSLPPGLIGDPNAVAQCAREQFDAEECPAASQVGVDVAGLGTGAQGLTEFRFPVYNMVPPAGVPAQFGFTVFGHHTFLDAGVRSGGDYGITEHVDNVIQRQLVYNSTTIWGVPAESSHDAERCTHGDELPTCGRVSGVAKTPLLTLPTSCEGPQTFSLSAEAWQEGVQPAAASFLSHDGNGSPIGFTGCDHLGFEPSISVAPDTAEADTPAGLTVEVKVPQDGLTARESLATSNIRDTRVVLPQGVAINPGQAAGLVACQAGEDGVGSEGPSACPAASKVGTVAIETPLLKSKLEGNVYVLQSNPPNLQLLVAASGEGVNLKLVGDVHLDEVTGRLTATFSRTPELPFTDFKLSFSGGAQAALVTPTTCGTYTTMADFTPWSTPSVPDVAYEDSFGVSSGPGGGACPSTPLPFAPVLSAGATTDQAGGYTNFSLLLTREDGQQRVSTLQFKTPEGLLGMISKVPLCGEPAASQGACPEASQIGHTIVAAGPGPYPLVVPEPGQPPAPIYLTGGYKGAPYGLSIAVPVIAGPFNLGRVVVRASIAVDPHTAQLTVTTDPLPAILDGIPTDLRTINAVIDRPGFMFNPTDCSPGSFSGIATSTEGAQAAISSHFQMGSCRSLTFKPNFLVSTAGRTSRKNGASLDAKILYPTGAPGNNQASSQSNIASVKVDLPKQLPSRLTTLQKACTAAQFDANPAGCPKASLVGHASALTPVLPVALSGPAYFVSRGGEAFPQLIVVLQGYGVTVDLVGDTFINKTGITSSTFKQVPDVPITSFELTLPQGPFSALAANLPAKAKGSFCGQSLTMPTAFTGHNGAVIHQSTKITISGCATSKKKAKRHTAKGKLGK